MIWETLDKIPEPYQSVWVALKTPAPTGHKLFICRYIPGGRFEHYNMPGECVPRDNITHWKPMRFPMLPPKLPSKSKS